MGGPNESAELPKAILFDFDGTLADSYVAITASVNHVRAFHGLAPLSVAEVRPHVGKGPANLLAQTVPAGDNTHNVALYLAHHPSVLQSGTHLMPGAGDLLKALHSHGIRVGLCSNKNLAFSRTLLAHLGVASAFSVVMGPELVARSKPAPDMLLAALKQLEIPAAQALYIGDMVFDIQAGRAAGLRVWVVATGSDTLATLAQAEPDRLFHHLAEIQSALFPA
jgi:phosphoglycolate phosphatase